ncbi:MAG TPA: HD domain-containing protein [Polyangiaceae bacterium]|nr:HD domain-containing protein [Polyangiaceae bacterium]
MLLRDPVHGLLTFEHEEESIIVRLLDTPEVQRLRRIRQLGLTCLAFPGAEHTRFAHALGAAYVMQRFIERLRQIHDELPFWQRLTSERARDALAAAFLHDLGHGPLSHLFEDALAHTERAHGLRSAPLSADGIGADGVGDSNISRRHEDWTEQILLDPSTSVHKVLVQDDPELPRRVAGLIRGRHPLPYLARAVSGTFDVDRCDYLLRDAHATGVRYGEYDLPWLLSTLRFTAPEPGSEVRTDPDDEGAAPGLAIDGSKGLSAIESFILARLFMFQQVYLHKSTRAAEWMIRVILIRAVALLKDGTRLPRVPAALAAIAAGEAPSLGAYLELDDQVLLEALNTWRQAADPVLADLCERLRARELFKVHELYGEAAEPSRRAQALEIVRGVAEEAGLDPDLYTGLDVAVDTPYSDDSSLSVIFPDGRVRRPAEVSFVLDRLRDETLTRVRLMFAPELKDEVRAALMER